MSAADFDSNDETTLSSSSNVLLFDTVSSFKKVFLAVNFLMFKQMLLFFRHDKYKRRTN